MFLVDPSLVQERIKPGPGGKDYVTTHALTPLWLGQLVVAGLDVGRYHWSDGVPLAVQVLAMLAMAAGLALLVWAESVNRFFSSVVRIQTDRGHHVITSGPYRYVRHPGYAASLFIFAGGGLALGSWLSALIGGSSSCRSSVASSWRTDFSTNSSKVTQPTPRGYGIGSCRVCGDRGRGWTRIRKEYHQ